MATTGQDKLTPVSVAVTNQMIGLLIQALCVLHVTMHRQAKSSTDLSTDVLIVYQDVQSHLV